MDLNFHALTQYPVSRVNTGFPCSWHHRVGAARDEGQDKQTPETEGVADGILIGFQFDRHVSTCITVSRFMGEFLSNGRRFRVSGPCPCLVRIWSPLPYTWPGWKY